MFIGFRRECCIHYEGQRSQLITSCCIENDMRSIKRQCRWLREIGESSCIRQSDIEGDACNIHRPCQHIHKAIGRIANFVSLAQRVRRRFSLHKLSFHLVLFCTGPMNVNRRKCLQVLRSQAIRLALEDHVAAQNRELSNNQSHDLNR